MSEQQVTVNIRIAKQDDAATIASFNVAMALETENHALDLATVTRGASAVIKDPAHGFYLVAESSGEVSGCLLVTYEWSDWRNGQMWWIQSVYVSPDHRGSGVYKKLYQEVVNRARQRSNVPCVRLYVEKDNLRAQSVYKKLGMVNSGYLVYEVPIQP